MSPTIILLGIVAQFVFAGIRLVIWFRSSKETAKQVEAAIIQSQTNDIAQCMQIFGELRGLLVTHQKVLAHSQSPPSPVDSLSVDRMNSIVSDPARRCIIPVAMHSRVDKLGEVLDPYGIYSSERAEMEDYADRADDLEALLQSISENGSEDRDPLLKLVREMMEENSKLRTTVDDCQSKISELITSSNRSAIDAKIDALTQLPNRRAWMEEVPSLETKGDLFLAMIDLDHFKEINDTYGHAAGDAVLQMVARIFRESAQPKIFRMGGDEFLMFFRGRTPTAAEHTINEIRNRLEKSSIVVEGNKLSITMSCGVTRAEEGEQIDAIVRRADMALYRAKERGRNFVVLIPGPKAMSGCAEDSGDPTNFPCIV